MKSRYSQLPNASLRGRRLKGRGQGVLGARETRGAREEGGKETPVSTPLYFSFFSFPPSSHAPRVSLAPKSPCPFQTPATKST